MESLRGCGVGIKACVQPFPVGRRVPQVSLVPSTVLDLQILFILVVVHIQIRRHLPPILRLQVGFLPRRLSLIDSGVVCDAEIHESLVEVVIYCIVVLVGAGTPNVIVVKAGMRTTLWYLQRIILELHAFT